MSAEQWPEWLTDDSPVDFAVATLARKLFRHLQASQRENAELKAKIAALQAESDMLRDQRDQAREALRAGQSHPHVYVTPQFVEACAKRLLAQWNRECEGTGTWPNGQEWDELVPSSHGTLLRHACEILGIEWDEYLKLRAVPPLEDATLTQREEARIRLEAEERGAIIVYAEDAPATPQPVHQPFMEKAAGYLREWSGRYARIGDDARIEWSGSEMQYHLANFAGRMNAAEPAAQPAGKQPTKEGE